MMMDKESSREVFIDGVRYVPAMEAVPDVELVKEALMALFMGTDAPEDMKEWEGSVYVNVTDEHPILGAPTLKEFGDNLAAFVVKKHRERYG